jgi:hypothetical protein
MLWSSDSSEDALSSITNALEALTLSFALKAQIQRVPMETLDMVPVSPIT